MPGDATDSHLIKNRQLIDEPSAWTLVSKDSAETPSGDYLVLPAGQWLQLREDSHTVDEPFAIWLDSDEPPELIADDLDLFAFVAINFPVFNDGRGYSYARTLRERYHYNGEIRAIGDVLVDQLLYLHRSGFNAFELRGDQDPQAALARFDDFSEFYQAAQDQSLPLFARR